MADETGGSSSGSELALQIASLLQNNNHHQQPKLSDNLQFNLKLNNQNYALWTRMIRVAIGGKSKTLLNHLTENPPEKVSLEKYEIWEQEDLIVFSWLIQNIEPTIAGNLTEFSTSKELWDALVTTYSSGKDKLQAFNLHVKANELKQHEKTLEDFWISLQGVWGEIDRIDPNPMKCADDIQTYAKIRSDQKLFQFLNEAAYATVRKEAAHQKILGATNIEPQGVAAGLIAREINGDGFVTKGYRRFDGKKKIKDDKSDLSCDECGMERHTKEQCFRLVGYPAWWTENKKGVKRVPTTSTNTTKEIKNDNQKKDGGFGGLAAAGGVEDEGVFSVEDFSDISNSRKTHIEAANKGKMDDIRTGQIIGRGAEREGLYYVDEVSGSGNVMLAHGTNEREAWLWHRRLGHPSFQQSIKIVRSDNGGEYVNSQMKQFFQLKGIIHQTTCPHTPQQNGVAERKNRLLLEMTRALVIESCVPKQFWPEAVATATYLINRLPTKILKMKTPLKTLTTYHTLPSALTLPPKVFGCTVFVHIPKMC
uniref:uncharacterized protein LOC122610138 n=1 Tax=Erigeron canadensis TaxID=72917 RepID=UPI001CB94FF9|nr:uncharacterized protein LOC122610138 [Erigeron canadensis]